MGGGDVMQQTINKIKYSAIFSEKNNISYNRKKNNKIEALQYRLTSSILMFSTDPNIKSNGKVCHKL